MNAVVKAWLESAEMDLENIRIITGNEFLTPVSIFHSQQCIEKVFKAVLELRGMAIPKTHDLLRLFSLASDFFHSEIDIVVLQKLNDVYIDSRYPGDFGLLPDGKPSIDEAEGFYQFARSIFNIVKGSI